MRFLFMIPDDILITFLGVLLGIGPAALIGGIALRIGAKWSKKTDFSYWKGFKHALGIVCVNMVIAGVMVLFLNRFARAWPDIQGFVVLPIWLIVGASRASKVLDLEFGRAVLINLIWFALFLPLIFGLNLLVCVVHK